jgi:SAM-dependent methyltransferase
VNVLFKKSLNTSLKLQNNALAKIVGNLSVLLENILKNLRLKRVSYFVHKIENAADFPSIAASQQQMLDLSLRGFQETWHSMNELIQIYGNKQTSSEVSQYSNSAEVDVNKLNSVFSKYGSDKGKLGYTEVYVHLIDNLGRENLNILEIGIGTNHVDVPSNMGKHGSPGASLLSWREYVPNSNIYGCDIDSRILFDKDGIKTFYLDQTSSDSWRSFCNSLGDTKFDLIVDDGLHAPFANLRTFIEIQSILRKGGYFVIEDVPERSINVWHVVKEITSNTWESNFIRLRKSYLLIFKSI